MNEEDFRSLTVGDVIRGRSTRITFVVTANDGERVIAVRTQEASNPDEWDLIVKANPTRVAS